MKTIGDVIFPSCKSVAVAGHVNPDGDCIGSCTALYLYIRKNFPEISAALYLEMPVEGLRQMPGLEDAKTELPPGAACDIFFMCDTSSPDRVGVAGALADTSGQTVCIDHHVSNPGFADINHILPEASSCAEVLFGLMEYDRIDTVIAAALYTGIIHDSGVFQYSNTSPKTMRIAASLLEKGIDFSGIIDHTFHERTFTENRVTGFALSKAELFFDGRCILSLVTTEEQRLFDALPRDMGLAVAELRVTAGVEVAVMIYQKDEGEFKVSLRSNGDLDVAAIASSVGGGGHVRAAGCTLFGDPGEVRAQILDLIGACL